VFHFAPFVQLIVSMAQIVLPLIVFGSRNTSCATLIHIQFFDDSGQQ
jgi:hypothetical protein